MSCRIVVLISGSGSNLQALIDSLDAQHPGKIVAVLSNRSDAYGLTRAQNAQIPCQVLSHKDFASREDFDAAMIKAIDHYQPDLVVLAGFMRILSPLFVRHYAGRLFNIHPSLLPKYKGLDTHQRALDAGEREHGCSVHFVSEELDGGPLVVQAAVPVEAGDNVESLAQRVHQAEHKIYPLAVRWFAEGRLKQTEAGVLFDQQVLPPSGVLV